MSSLLITNGRVVDPSSKMDNKKDVFIVDGVIKEISDKISKTADQIIDAKGLIVTPGLIDMHSHLRDPGNPEEETLASGTASAAMGGFTSVLCMANTDPVIDNPAVVKYVVSKAKAEAFVNVFPVGAVTKKLQGNLLTEMGRMIDEGVIAFSDDGHPISNSLVMRHALEYLSQFDLPIISHSEDKELTENTDMNEGYYSTIWGLMGNPAVAEEMAIQREIILAREYGRIHIAHVSCARSVQLIRQAKKEGIKITAETAPHYFSLTEKDVEGYNTMAKVNPPLRSDADKEEIIKGLQDGTIDVIATDHAPHIPEDKNIEFRLAASGMVGFETALPLTLTKLVNTKKIKLADAINLLSCMPAKILKLKNKGSIKTGFDADVVIFDPKEKNTIKANLLSSLSHNTPFDGCQLEGKVKYTIVGGRVVVKDGVLQKI